MERLRGTGRLPPDDVPPLRKPLPPSRAADATDHGADGPRVLAPRRRRRYYGDRLYRVLLTSARHPPPAPPGGGGGESWWSSAWPVDPQVRLAVSVVVHLGSRREVFGAAPMIFGTLVSSLLALRDRGAAGARRRDLPHRVRAQVAAPADRVPHRAARGDSERRLRAVGHLRADPLPPGRRRPAPARGRSDGPRSSAVRSTDRRMLAAGIILAIMIMPYIAAVSREVLLAVPDSQREAALALGATRWEAVCTSVLPYGRAGIIGAVILGLGRALGETMAVTMVIGNRHDIAASLLPPGYTMAAAIANEFSEATTNMHLSALIDVGPGALRDHHRRQRRGAAARLARGARARRWGARRCEPPGDASARAQSAMLTGVVVMLCALAVLPLFLILADLVLKGEHLSLDFFTKIARARRRNRRRRRERHRGHRHHRRDRLR